MLKYMLKRMCVALMLMMCASTYAGQATVAWDSPGDQGISGHRIYYGQSSRDYTSSVAVGSQTSYTITGLEEGRTFYFAVTAISSSGESDYSREVSKSIPYSSPTADFSASPLSGTAPLTVSFNDNSTGSITARSWDFGNGSTSTASSALYSYGQPGTYSVSLTVAGPGGSDKKIRTGYITVRAADSGSGGVDTGAGGVDTGIVAPVTGGDTGVAAPVTGSDTGAAAPVTSDGDTTSRGADTGLVAAYSFDETSGTTVEDSSGNGNTGMILGAKRSANGKYGKSLLFDGVDDWVTVADNGTLDLDKGMTIEAWIHPTTTLSSWRTVVMKEQSGGASYYMAANSDANKPANGVYIGAEQILRSGTRPKPNIWTHLAVTYDGSYQRLYIDGTQVGKQLMSGQIQHSNGVLRIGGNSIWGEYFKGYIDEVRIYNRVLTDKEIRTDIGTSVAKSLVIEAGEVMLDHNWKRIDFKKNSRIQW